MTEGQAERSQSAADNLRTAGLDERAISRLGELKRQILELIVEHEARAPAAGSGA